MNPKVTLPFYAKLAFVLVILIAAGYLAILGKDILTPLLFSLLFSLLLLPLANFQENRLKLPRGVAAILSVIIFFAFAALILYILGSQIASLSQEWPQLKDQLSVLTSGIQKWAANTLHINIAKQTTYINNAGKNLLKSSGVIVEQTILSVSAIVLFLVFIFIYTFFLLYYRRLLMRFVVAAFSEKYISIIYDISEQVKHIIKKYILGLFFEMTIVAAIGCTAFFILGIKYALMLGLMVGIFNVIPYIGIFTALLISVSITFSTSESRYALFVAIVIICIHLFDSNFLMPKIVGSQVRVNPLIVIIGVIAGEMIWGIPGMFLSIPYIAIAKVIFDRVDGLQPWGILLGDEEHPPRKVNKLLHKIKRKETAKKV